MELKRKEHQIFYFKQKNEVDFLTIDSDGKKHLYQVCYDLSAEETLEREIAGVAEAMEMHRVKKGSIIYCKKPATLPASQQVQYIAAWDFLLGS